MAYSSIKYTGDGVTTDFAVTFDYLDRDHVKVRVNKVFTEAVGSLYKTAFVNSTTLRVDTVSGNNPVPSGVEVELIRQTPIDVPAVVFGGGASLSSANLNKNSEYLTFALQEATDTNEEFTKVYLGSFTSFPTTDNEGNPIRLGAVIFYTPENAIYYYTAAGTWSVGESVSLTQAAAATATSSASNASLSATASAGSATAAAGSATAAAGSALASSNSASAAEASATEASDSATAAAGSALASSNSASAAEASATVASDSAAAAAASAAAAENVVGIDLNNIDINGGTLDGTVIGGSTPAAISGTTGSFSGNLTVDTNTLFVDAVNNRVGVGTSSPVYTLDVAGAISAGSGTVAAASYMLNLANGTADSVSLRRYSSGLSEIRQMGGSFQTVTQDANPILLGTNNVERMRIDASGRVGIGVNSPASQLHIRSTGEQRLIVEGDSNNQPGEDASWVEIRTDGGAVKHIIGQPQGTFNNLSLRAGGDLTNSSGVSAGMDFWTKPGLSDPMEVMRLTPQGNLGIGTTAPTQRLTVDGDSLLDGDVTITGVLSANIPGLVPGVSVDALGAVGNGTTNDTSAFQAAIDQLPTNGGEVILGQGKNYIVTTGSLNFGTKQVFWNGNATVNGQVYRGLVGINEGYDAPTNRRVFHVPDGKLGDFANWDFRRAAAYSGGNTGNPDSAVRVYTEVNSTVGSAGNRKAEWAFQARIDNNSPNANAVGMTGQARRFSTGAVWSGHFNTIDNTATSTYASRAIEANIQADGPDSNDLRWVIDACAKSISDVYNASNNDEIYAGLIARADSANMRYGVIVRDEPNKGSITGSALFVRTDTQVLNAMATSIPARVLLGRSTSTNGSNLSELFGRGHNASGAEVNYTNIKTRINDSTTGSESGLLELEVISAGASTIGLRLNGGQTGNALSVLVGSSLKQVTQGDVDSGGAGFRVLRVPN